MEPEFTIVSIRLTESHFKLNTDFKIESGPVEIKAGVHLTYETKDKRVNVTLSVNSDAHDQPFVFSVAVQGVFEFAALPSAGEVKRIAHMNCAGIIFPFVRETAADLTRRAGVPPFVMEPINFVALYDQIAVDKSKGIKKGKRGCKTE